MAKYDLAILALCVISASVAVEDDDTCVQGVNCFLPDCFCPTFTHFMGARNIPQMVYFAFDDAVTPELADYFDEIFTEERKNPNDCPITMSLFVSHRNTHYDLVSDYFMDYDEIGVHSVTHTYIRTEEKLREEAIQQRRNIQDEANIPKDLIIGWRSPDLITAGDIQPRVLKELNYTYDISLPYEVKGKFAFPYTLDYGYPYGCSIRPCPSKHSKHPGFWEVPINAHWDPSEDNMPCCYVDGCRPPTEEAAYNFLMHNFNVSFFGERAPFGLSMHAAWFYFPMYLAATQRFVHTILNDPIYQSQTYIISTSQMMAWMKNPQKIESCRTFQPWECPMYKAKRAQKAKAVKPPKPVLEPGMFGRDIVNDFDMTQKLSKSNTPKTHDQEAFVSDIIEAVRNLRKNRRKAKKSKTSFLKKSLLFQALKRSKYV